MPLSPQDKQEIVQIIQEQLRDNYISGNPKVPPHQHNGIDNLKIPSVSVAAPDTSIQFNNAGILGGSSSFEFIENNFGSGPVAPTIQFTNIYGIQSQFGLSTNGEGFDWSVTGGGSYIQITAPAFDITSDLINLNGINGAVIINNFNPLATNATTGFMAIPYCAGTPTGVPTAGIASVIYDTTNDKLWIYNGSAWKSAAFT